MFLGIANRGLAILALFKVSLYLDLHFDSKSVIYFVGSYFGLLCGLLIYLIRRHLDDIKKYVPEFVPEFIPEFDPEFDVNTDFYTGTNSGMNSGTNFFHVV